MVIELNRTSVTHSKDIWFRVLKLWLTYIKSNTVTHSSCDKTLKQLLEDELISVSQLKGPARDLGTNVLSSLFFP